MGVNKRDFHQLRPGGVGCNKRYFPILIHVACMLAPAGNFVSKVKDICPNLKQNLLLISNVSAFSVEYLL